MAAASRKSSGPVIRALSPAGSFRNSRPPPKTYSSTATASTSCFHRSSSPTRVNLHAPVPSIRFGSISTNRSISAERHNHNPKRSCMCSPTTHPGSFRCSLHKNLCSPPPPPHYAPSRAFQGQLLRRASSALIRPSSHQHRRRGDFQPRPSRLSVMSKP